MSLIDDVKAICDRLGPLGLRSVLLTVTGGQLDIQKPNAAALKTELTQNLTSIDRTIGGFTDFALSGTRAIKAGAPAESLLYHALASPNVKGGFKRISDTRRNRNRGELCFWHTAANVGRAEN